MKIFDPTSAPIDRAIVLAPRPAALRGLRVGLVENTKFNSDRLLTQLAERLARAHGVTVSRMIRKRSPSHPVSEEAAEGLRRVSDFVVSGIGD
jgi:hypothetical protein